jgi:quercetin 2,3-dioxygenase
MGPVVDIRRAADRAITKTGWLNSRHSFSFGDHYDPRNTHHGLLLVNNDDVVAPGSGFNTHPHRDMEIVTWVLDGSLVHKDSEGNSGVIYPGLAQRMSAGTGILHSESNASQSDPVHFIQMWVLPDRTGITPGYQQAETELAGLTTIASGRHGDAVITIHNRNAALHVAKLAPSEGVELPCAPYLHLFVARGEVTLEAVAALSAGDAVRLTDSGGQRVTADESSEVLIWEMHAELAA